MHVYLFVWDVHFGYRLLWEQRTGLRNQQEIFQTLRLWQAARWQCGALCISETWHQASTREELEGPPRGGLPCGKLHRHCEHYARKQQLWFVSWWITPLCFKEWIKDTVWSRWARIPSGVMEEPWGSFFCLYTENSEVLNNQSQL